MITIKMDEGKGKGCICENQRHVLDKNNYSTRAWLCTDPCTRGMKMPPAVSVDRVVTAIGDLWPPKVNEGSQNCDNAFSVTPTVMAEELGACRKQPPALFKVNGKQDQPRQLRCAGEEWIQ